MTESRTEKVSRANEFINDYLDKNQYCVSWCTPTNTGKVFFNSLALAEAHPYYSEFKSMREHQREMVNDYMANINDHPGRNKSICDVAIWECDGITEKVYNRVINYVNDGNESAATELLTQMQLETSDRIAYKESIITDEKDEVNACFKLRFNCWSRKNEENPDEETTHGLTYIISTCQDAVKRNSAWERLLLMNPTNFQLTDIIESCMDSELRNRAGEKLLTLNPTNRGLAYIMCYCTDNNLKNESWEMLQTQHPTGMDMTCILCLCDNEDLRNRSLKWLQKYDVSNSSLVETMEMCSDKNVRNSIGEILRKNLRIKEIDL